MQKGSQSLAENACSGQKVKRHLQGKSGSRAILTEFAALRWPVQIKGTCTVVTPQ